MRVCGWTVPSTNSSPPEADRAAGRDEAARQGDRDPPRHGAGSDPSARPVEEAVQEADRVRRAGDLFQAAALLLIDPLGLGGARLHGPPGPVRDAWLALLQDLAPPGMPCRRMPATIADDRLLGGLDLTATLQTGRPVLQHGLLAQADGGLVVAAMAERLPPGTAAGVCAALDAREVRLERDGLARVLPARVAVVALDESQGDDPPLAPALADRLGLWLALDGLARRDTVQADATMVAEVARARHGLGGVTVTDDLVEGLCAATLALGVDSPRAAWQALCCARAAAAWHGRTEADADDAALAVRLVLAPRATRVPVAPDDAGQVDPRDPPPPPDGASAQEPPHGPSAPPPAPTAAHDADERSDPEAAVSDPGTLEARLVATALASLPPGVLARLMDAGRSAVRAQAAGRVGTLAASHRHGRPVGSRPGLPSGGARLHLIDTLRAAAPWQRWRTGGPLGPQGCRGPSLSGPDPSWSASLAHTSSPGAAAPAPALVPQERERSTRRILVRAGDFRIRRLRQPRATTTIFALDASGSSALHRLGEAKGAVESLLAECYVRRDEVAVIAFRGAGAELVLPPTRALARARRGLAGLPGGGGTPLTAGIDAAAALAQQVRRRGATPVIVLLTDGRANVARDGQGGRERARQEALHAAGALRAQGGRVLLIDTSVRPEPAARTLAEAAGARYLVLPRADAATLHRAVQAASRPA